MNINLKQFDRTRHVTLNGDPLDLVHTRDLLIVEQVGKTVEDDNQEQTYSQRWRVAYRGVGLDRAEVESIVRDHFYHFQECGGYQNASFSGSHRFTVSGGLDI